MRKFLLRLFSILCIYLIVSCEKGEEQFPPVLNNEKNIILLPDGGNLVTKALDINNSVITYDILRIDRNTTNAGELNKTQVVKIQKNNSVLSELGEAQIIELPRDYYQSHPDNPFDGEFWTVTFQPGERTKYLKLDIRSVSITSLGRVGLGFQIAEANNAQISSTKNQVAVEISAKNQLDGVYKVKYRLFHPTSSSITGNGTIDEWDFLSSGPTSIDWDLATIFIDFASGGLTYFGDAAGPSLLVRMTVNPDNSVSISNVGSRAAALAFPPLVVPPGVTNRYDPATKTFYVAYTWTPAGSGTREKYDTLTYIRPR
ncbi:MAG TPA: hypothetical protein VF144_14535 [Chitinophagaceae bacterium]